MAKHFVAKSSLKYYFLPGSREDVNNIEIKFQYLPSYRLTGKYFGSCYLKSKRVAVKTPRSRFLKMAFQLPV